jgi:predicted SprT family Zn-dependent metalloprotease
MICLSNKIVRTRKDHKCWGCTKLFPKGSLLKKITSVDGGEILTVYYCGECQYELTMIDSRDYQDGILYGELTINKQERERYERL